MNTPSKTAISVRIFLASLFPFLSNIIVVLVNEQTAKLTLTHEEKRLITHAIESTNVPFIVITFAAGALAVIIYMWPCLRWMFTAKVSEALLQKVKKRILYMPLVISIMGLVGWGVYSPAYFLGAAMQGIPLMTNATLAFVLDRLLTAFMSYTLCYYPMELIVRDALIPHFFPDGDFSRHRDSWRPTVRTRLYMLYFSVGVFPMYMMYVIILHRMDNRPFSNGMLPVTLAFGILLCTGFYITYLISRLLHDPLVEMRRAVAEVRSGNLDVAVKVESNDEVGNLGEAINGMVRDIKEKEFIKDTFGKLVDPAVRDHLLSGNIELGGDTMEATVLFCDIRGFSSLSEKMNPEDIVDMLNRFFEGLSGCIMAEKGIVDKYIGDAVMAVFGAPVPLENAADAAVAAAKRIHGFLPDLNTAFAERGIPALDIGIGIHTGQVLMGNIGSRSRMEYTAIGDTVNIAARVEKLCKRVPHRLLITESTASRLSARFSPVFVEQSILRGKEISVNIFAV